MSATSSLRLEEIALTETRRTGRPRSPSRPETVKLPQSMPSINPAMFTLLGPGGRLPHHRAPFAGSMRYHLGLLTPDSDDFYLEIDGEHPPWHDGEGLLFDETYIHTAINETDQDPVIFFCDVSRPLRFPPARWINHFIIHHVVKLTQTRNEEGEKVGAFNKAFGGVYKLRTLAKQLKAWNKKVYYVLKFVLLGGLLGLVLLW